MLRIRLVEQTIAARYAEQRMRCPVHLSIGQEAIAVGVCSALRPDDRVLSTHRCHAHYLAKGGDLKRMIAELHGKAAGCNGGRGGSMHLFDAAAGMVASLPIVASAIPVAAGMALADKLDGLDRVTVVFFGDAAVEEGAFHETCNIASVKKLPVLFVCEDNGYSIHTPRLVRQPMRPIEDLAHAHGIGARWANGNDVLAVAKEAGDAVEDIRAGHGPQFLVCDTQRLAEHCGPGPAAADEVSRTLLDPLADADAGAWPELVAEINDAFAFAVVSAEPSPHDACHHVTA